MKLFIWEGEGITTGYHQDGTLVVLAEDVHQARRLARDSAKIWNKVAKGKAGWDGNWLGALWADGAAPYRGIYIEKKPALAGQTEWMRDPVDLNPAIDRDPDRIVVLDHAQVVAWNGGGYD